MHIKFFAIPFGFLLFSTTYASENCGELSSALSKDLAVFEEKVLGVDVPFQSANYDYTQDLVALAECPPNHPAELELALARILGKGGNGHSLLLNFSWPTRFNRIAGNMLVLDDGIYLLGGSLERPMCKLESINDVPITELVAYWTSTIGHAGGISQATLPVFLESPEVLHAAGFGKQSDRVSLQFADCKYDEMTAGPPVQNKAHFHESRILKFAHAGYAQEIPLWLEEPEKSQRFVWLDGETLYVQLRDNAGASMKDFVSAVLKELKRQPPRNIIFDQRLNLGGDLTTTRKLIDAMAKVANDGKVVALTSGRTFSAAIYNLARLKGQTNLNLYIIGQPVGDALEFWSEGSVVSLPNSGAALLVATERHNYMTGCPEPDCHRPIQKYSVKVPHVKPDLSIQYTAADFKQGNDPALAAARAHLAE